MARSSRGGTGTVPRVTRAGAMAAAGSISWTTPALAAAPLVPFSNARWLVTVLGLWIAGAVAIQLVVAANADRRRDHGPGARTTGWILITLTLPAGAISYVWLRSRALELDLAGLTLGWVALEAGLIGAGVATAWLVASVAVTKRRVIRSAPDHGVYGGAVPSVTLTTSSGPVDVARVDVVKREVSTSELHLEGQDSAELEAVAHDRAAPRQAIEDRTPIPDGDVVGSYHLSGAAETVADDDITRPFPVDD